MSLELKNSSGPQPMGRELSEGSAEGNRSTTVEISVYGYDGNKKYILIIKYYSYR